MASRGSKGTAAELLFQRWLEAQGWLVHRAARAGFVRLPNGKGFCRSYDIFGCFDLLAVRSEQVPHLYGTSSVWAIQVTTQAGRAHRRTKIEERVSHLPLGWRISLATQETTLDPADYRRKLKYWRVEDYRNGAWQEPVALPLGAE